MSEIIFEIVALGFEDIEGFVLDFPACASGVGEIGDIVGVDGQIGDEAVAIGDLAPDVLDDQFQPVDRFALQFSGSGQVKSDGHPELSPYLGHNIQTSIPIAAPATISAMTPVAMSSRARAALA